MKDPQFDFERVLLRPELLEMIFHHLAPKSHLQIMTTCKTFYEVLQLQKFSQKISLIFQMCYIDENCEPMKIFLKSTSRKFYNLKIGLNVTEYLDNSKFWHSIGKDIKTLTFAEDSPKQLYQPNLTGFLNLKEVEVQNNEIFNNIKTNLPNSVDTIKFEKFNYVLEIEEPFKARKNIKSIITTHLKQISLGHLPFDVKKFLAINFPKVSDSEFSDQFDVLPLNLLEKKLEITADQVTSIYDWNRRRPLDEFINLKKLSTKIIGEGCFFIHQAMLNKRICEFEVLTCRELTCRECFTNLVLSFPLLQALSIHAIGVPLNMLTKNLTNLVLTTKLYDSKFDLDCPNLESLTLKFLDPYCTFDIETLKQMPKLRILEINKPTSDHTNLIQISNIEGLKDCCPNLEELILDKVHIDQILRVEELFPHLTILKFRLIAECNDDMLINLLKGKFTRLRIFGYPNERMCKCLIALPSRVQLNLFTEIPTLRQTYFGNFQLYQKLTIFEPEWMEEMMFTKHKYYEYEEWEEFYKYKKYINRK